MQFTQSHITSWITEINKHGFYKEKEKGKDKALSNYEEVFTKQEDSLWHCGNME